ncbi:phosphate ABC transporter permease subunit PstC [Acetobacterium bakii]|uniref:Phosphate ABC transporter permease n=1 Tax=Acetobacterium bakii TaxID=52689 RepID=A0A0L6U693_9FIRM|nr:phosphate ABC transporter permease subunit PstC [Acetobacterium bakii]KNZ43315.1 phosphate ABC transporter permease [Acetobacterium bakii]
MEAIKRKKIKEKIIENFFLICAFVAVVSVLAITFFVFYNGLKPFVSNSYPFWNFISGVEWRPGSNMYGIFYMIVGSIFGTLGAILLGVPIAILTAVYIAEMADSRIGKIIRFAVELLAGIPSVLYGVFGLGIIVPYVLKISPMAQGESLLATILVLAIMILPTVVSISETSISAVPKEYREGSYALGASKIQTIFKVVLPAARSGVMTGVILGIGRAIGETMAVMLVCGNPIAGIPTSLFDQIRPLTTNIALEMGYASGVHQELLYSTGVVLFVFIMIINLAVNKLVKTKVGS